MLEVLARFERAGDAAVTLAVFNADMMEKQIRHFAGWELGVQRLEERSGELGRHTAGLFDEAFKEWKTHLHQLIASVSNSKGPAQRLQARPARFKLLERFDVANFSGKIEMGVESLAYYLRLQGWIMDGRNCCSGAPFLCEHIACGLDAAWDAAWKGYSLLKEAVMAVESSPPAALN